MIFDEIGKYCPFVFAVFYVAAMAIFILGGGVAQAFVLAFVGVLIVVLNS